MNSEMISLKNELFTDAISSADMALAMLISKMKHRGAVEGKMTLSIEINLDPEDIINPVTGATEPIDRVSIHYKAGYSVPDKDSIAGDIINKSAAIVNVKGCPHIAEISDEQTSIF